MKLQHPRKSSPYRTPENSIRDVMSGIRVANTHHIPVTDTPDNSVVYPNVASKDEYDSQRRPDHTLYRKMEIKNKIIDSVEINWDELTTLMEDGEDNQDNSKRAIATLIANNMSRFSEKNNQKGMLILLAALSLLELSDGNDSLMAVAKRLVSYGMSGKGKR